MVNNKLKFVKSATAFVIGATVLTGSFAVTGASDKAFAKAATVKVLKGKLVSVKTGKVVKGYKSYKSVVYKNGVKFTGVYKSTYYKVGKKATGTYKNVYYKTGKAFTGVANKTYYKAGKKATGTYKNVYYKTGKAYTGVVNNTYYKTGKKATGLYKGVYYKTGKAATGIYENKLYVSGNLSKGLVIFQDQLYKDASLNKGLVIFKDQLYKDASLNKGLVIFKDQLYKDAALNKGLVIFQGQLYKDATLNKGLEKFEDKFYFDAALANDTYTVEGVERAFENGVEVGAKVKAVEAINAKQVKVTFNKSINEDTVLDSSSKLVAGSINFNESASNTTAAVTAANATGEFTDANTLVITLGTGEIFDGAYTVSATKAVKTTGKESIEEFSKAFSVSDKVAPTVESVTAKTNSTIATSAKVKFSEPVSAAVVKIDGTVYTPASGNGTDELTFNGLSLNASSEHTVEVLNATDYNNNVTPLQTKSFTVNQDTVAPVATAVASGDHAILLTFDKDMTVSTVAGAVKVLDEKLGTVSSTVTQVGTSKTKFLVAMTGTTLYDNAASRSLTVVVDDSAKDSLGNKVSTTTKAVSLVIDVTAPTVSDVAVENDSNGNAKTLKVTFSEELKAVPADLTGVTAKDATTGTTATVTDLLDATAIKLSDDKKTVEIPVKPAAQGNKYNFAFAKGFVKDTALTANDSTGYAKTVAFDKAGSAFKLAQTDLDTTTQNTIVITFAKAVVGDFGANAVNNPANYTVAGQALPAGTDITIDAARTEVTIVLPSDFVATTDTNAVLTVNNIKATDGSSLAAFIGFANVKDNIAPQLNKVVWNTNGSFTLDFNENIATIGAEAGYEVKVNDTVIPSTAYTFAPGTGSDAGNIVATFVTATDATYGTYIVVDDSTGNEGYTAGKDILVGNVSKVSVKVLDTNTTADSATNVAKSGITVSATK
ncbi:hypothetical protein JFL43_07955 [Viridibacillus sp. YIM B01967]|uniref:SbsA Ig-like domain-containing protein n=1 Tax=Viridibacillus soli TaxID=2798301 RepID=A0ABS1H5V8_9BACL|nr:hypothetical protein [Viridibacillus soli]MBK3494792.1 hypothetical protein [Viridibacillus soli]